LLEPSESGEEDNSVAVGTWTPATVTTVLEAVCPDDLEVRILDMRDDAQVVAVVELVSPGNKDRPEMRGAFAAKCAAYLQRGIGLIAVDIVTTRPANLHAELVDLLRQPVVDVATDTSLQAAAHRPVRRGERNQTDVWLSPLAVGAALPVMPLPLRGAGCVPLDLDATYAWPGRAAGYEGFSLR
jgi:hypothetical protein